jgi:hypothetical protein
MGGNSDNNRQAFKFWLQRSGSLICLIAPRMRTKRHMVKELIARRDTLEGLTFGGFADHPEP